MFTGPFIQLSAEDVIHLSLTTLRLFRFERLYFKYDVIYLY